VSRVVGRLRSIEHLALEPIGISPAEKYLNPRY
jgi:hypothetical protein